MIQIAEGGYSFVFLVEEVQAGAPTCGAHYQTHPQMQMRHVQQVWLAQGLCAAATLLFGASAPPTAAVAGAKGREAPQRAYQAR